MASSCGDTNFAINTNHSASSRTDRWGVRTVGVTDYSKSTRRGERQTRGQSTVMDKVLRNFIVLSYTAILVTIILLLMLGVI